MIIDRIRLAGERAYLHSANGINLADSGSQPGVSPKIPEGKVLDVTGLQILVDGEALLKLLRFHEKPLMRIRVVKEMFPELFADPYTHRVHRIGGYEDFQRGVKHGLRAMEFDGLATLIATTTGDLKWGSPVYRMPHSITLKKAAWDLALSRSTPTEAFQYGLRLEVWQTGESPEDQHGKYVELAPPQTRPSIPRMNDSLVMPKSRGPVDNVIAYRVWFDARVSHDTQFNEYHANLSPDESIGGQLLHAVNLLEETQSSLTFHSLQELLAQSSGYDTFHSPRPDRMTVQLGLNAVLTENERIEFEVVPGIFKRIEVKLDASIRLRPPTIDKEVH